MKIRNSLLIIVLFSLTSCSTMDTAEIVNKTSDTLTLTLKLNYPVNEFNRTNFFRTDCIKKEKSQNKKYKLVGDCLESFDSSTNIVIMKLNPNDRLNLGAIRANLHRSDYRTWEFSEMNIKGNNFELNAKDKAIITFFETDKHLGGQVNYSFTIGQEH